MKICFDDRMELVRYVHALLMTSKLNSPLTMTIQPEALGAFSVLIATDESLDATEQDLAVLSFLPTQVNT